MGDEEKILEKECVERHSHPHPSPLRAGSSLSVFPCPLAISLVPSLPTSLGLSTCLGSLSVSPSLPLHTHHHPSISQTVPV